MTAKAAVATAAAKSSATTKTATVVGTLGAILTGGVLMVLSLVGFMMFLGGCIGFVMSRASARSTRQCDHAISFWRSLAIGVALFAVIPSVWFVWEPSHAPRIVDTVMTGWFALVHPLVLGALALWIWRWRRGASVPEAQGTVPERTQQRRLSLWLALGLIVPAFFSVSMVPNWLQNGVITKKLITPAEAQELITHRKDANFTVAHLPRGTGLVIYLPENKQVMLVTIADDATLDLLNKSGIVYTSEGAERANSDHFRLLAATFGLWSLALVPAGAVVLFRLKGRPYSIRRESPVQRPGTGEKRAWKAFAVSIALVLLGVAGFLGLATRWTAHTLTAAELTENINDLRQSSFRVFEYANGSKKLWICCNLDPDFIAPANNVTLGLLVQKGIRYDTLIQGRDFGYAMPGRSTALVSVVLLLGTSGFILWRVTPKTLLTGTAVAMLLAGVGLGLLAPWHVKGVSEPEARRLISESNPRVEIVKFKSGSKELWLTLPGSKKPPSIIAPANAATIAWLDKNQVQYQTSIQGRDFGFDTPGRGTALWCMVLLTMGAAALLRLACRKRQV